MKHPPNKEFFFLYDMRVFCVCMQVQIFTFWMYTYLCIIYVNLQNMVQRLRYAVTIHNPISILQGTYEKGSKDEIEEFIYQLSDVNGDGTLGR